MDTLHKNRATITREASIFRIQNNHCIWLSSCMLYIYINTQSTNSHCWSLFKCALRGKNIRLSHKNLKVTNKWKGLGTNPCLQFQKSTSSLYWEGLACHSETQMLLCNYAFAHLNVVCPCRDQILQHKDGFPLAVVVVCTRCKWNCIVFMCAIFDTLPFGYISLLKPQICFNWTLCTCLCQCIFGC